MNKTDLIANIKDYLNRPNLADSVVSLWIASVEGQLNRLLYEHPRMLFHSTYTQPAGNALLPLPADLINVIELHVKDVATYSMYGASQRENIQGFGYISRGACLEIFPTPATDTEFTLDYIAAIRPLSDTYTSNWISTYFPDLYIYGALKEAAVYLKDDARLGAWEKEWASRVNETVIQGWNQNIATVPLIKLGDNNALSM